MKNSLATGVGQIMKERTKGVKFFYVTAVLLGIINMCYGQEIGVDESAIEFGITADFYSKYIWRGQNLNDDYIFQPSIRLDSNYESELCNACQ